MKKDTSRREFLTAGILATIAAGCGNADVFKPRLYFMVHGDIVLLLSVSRTKGE